MKLWYTGLVLIVVGLVFVPASYFAIILNDLPQALDMLLLATWLIGFLAVPVGFIMVLVSLLRSRSQHPGEEGDGPVVPDFAGLVFIVIGLVLVPASYFAIILSDFPTPINIVLSAIWLIGFAAVPVGFLMLIVSADPSWKRDQSMMADAG